jgi:CheY-like chemotaxis protein
MSSDASHFPDPAGWIPVVLVVEDEGLLRLSISDHLKDCGYSVLEACDAHEAIEILEAGVEVDLVFTDVKMPGTIDGFGLAKWIRENRPQLAVFVASGYPGKVDLARDLCAGEQFFSKPYDVDKIAGKMKDHLVSRKSPH